MRAGWDAIATEAGFATHPRADFFEFAQFACEYDPLPPPHTIDGLIEMSSPIVLGTITAIEPIVRYPLNEETPYYVYMRVEVVDTLAGQAPSTMLVAEPCSHAAKVAGLRRLLPGDPLLFLLGGPFERPMQPAYYELQYYGLGIVGARADGVAFEHRWSGDFPPPSLDRFGSLNDLADHVRARAAAVPTEDP